MRRIINKKLKAPSRKLFKQCAFTLAEVLITLGIIGVVAAMTIPTLIQSYQESVYINQFKESYSILSQAYTQAAQEYGSVDTWTNWDDAGNHLKEYLKIQRDCYTNPNMSPPYFFCSAPMRKQLAGDDLQSYYYNLILSNGATLWFTRDGVMLMCVDVNGLKPPNRIGYDLFWLTLAEINGTPIVTYAYYPNTGFSTSSGNCNITATSGWGRGMSCSAWVLKHWNMDYLHRVIPDTEWSK